MNITDFSSAFADIFHLIGTRHRTLRKLYYHASINRTQRQHGNPDVVYRCMAREITKLPELRELTIDFLLLDGRWPIDHAKHIATFSRLNTLRIFVELNSEVSDFAKEYLVDPEEGGHMPLFDVKPAKKVTTDLFKSFFAHNPYSCLTSLESSIKIKRLERDDAPSPLDGGFVVDADGEWLHCDLRTQRTI
ncbi:MAG: hypothetical protein Q9199_004057 [Rusavskia elegans]